MDWLVVVLSKAFQYHCETFKLSYPDLNNPYTSILSTFSKIFSHMISFLISIKHFKTLDQLDEVIELYIFICSCKITFFIKKTSFRKFGKHSKRHLSTFVNFFLVRILKKMENVLIITVNCKKFCENFTQTKVTNVLYSFLLYLSNFKEDIL